MTNVGNSVQVCEDKFLYVHGLQNNMVYPAICESMITEGGSAEIETDRERLVKAECKVTGITSEVFRSISLVVLYLTVKGSCFVSMT